MSNLVCPRCQRTNPNEAVFCYFDGMILRQGVGVAANQLPREFVFPSGRRCRSYDDLVQGCQYDWEDARVLLQKGAFGAFLAGIGRMDLAQAASEGQAQPDPDIALYNFVNSLPAGQVQGPRLDLTPRRLMLGTLRAGDSRQVRLTVTNQGKGLLQGKLTVAEGGQWLRVDGAGTAGGNGQCMLKTAKEQQVTLRVETRGLPAPQTYSTRLQVITNGGIVEVPVRLDLLSVPFARPPFQGITTPRELAERMRTQPKPAVPLLESGEVERWFTANGWAYPVQGPPARGVAAVQQFFEGMGLSKPPPLQLSDNEIRLACKEAETVKGQVALRTTNKKWVYAHVTSDVPWLRVTTPSVSGPQQAVIAFEVDGKQVPAGRSHQALLQIAGNAGQKLTVRVLAEVDRPRESIASRFLRPFQEINAQLTAQAAVEPAVRPAIELSPAPLLGAGVFRAVTVGILLGLIYRFVLAWPADLYARVLMGPSGAGSFGTWLEVPPTGGSFVKHFVLATFWLGAIFGTVLLARRGSRTADAFCGLVAGAVAGVMGSATFACLMPVLDLVPRGLWHGLRPLVGDSRVAGAAWLWTPLWIMTAIVWWTVAGGAAGLVLKLLGQRGLSFLAVAAWPLTTLFQLCGLKRPAAFFALH